MIRDLAFSPPSGIRYVEFQHISESCSIWLYFLERFMILQSSFQLYIHWGLRLIHSQRAYGQRERMRSFDTLTLAAYLGRYIHFSTFDSVIARNASFVACDLARSDSSAEDII